MQFTIFVSAVLSVVGFAAAATPPACIINAIGVQGSDAADLTILCDTKQDYVLGNMTSTCTTDNLPAAYEYYSATCLEKAQITVSDLPTETSNSGSGTSSKTSGSSSSNSDGSSAESSDSDKESAATTVGAALGMPVSLAIAAFFSGAMALL